MHRMRNVRTDGTGRDGMGWDGPGWAGLGWDGMGWDGMGWDGVDWDGQAKLTADEISASDQIPTHVRAATSDFWVCDRCRKVTPRR